MRTTLLLIAAIALGSVFFLSATQAQHGAAKVNATTSPSSAQTAVPIKESLAPEPTLALKTLLDAIDKQLVSKQYAVALSAADDALKTAQVGKDPVGEALAQKRRAMVLDRLNRIEEAIITWKSVAELWGQISDGPGEVEALASAGILLMSSHADEAKQLVVQSIGLARSETKRPLQAARMLNVAAGRAYDRHQVALTQLLSEGALSLFDKLFPGSLDVATSLNQLGNVAYYHSDLVAAKDYYNRALEIQEKQAPVSLEVAGSLNNLGNVAVSRDDLAAAESYYKRALELKEKLSPSSLDVATSLNNLGNVAYFRGNLGAAESYYKRALEIREKLMPGSLDVAGSLNNLGNVSRSRGDHLAAESYLIRALEIQEKLAPGSSYVARSLHNLGAVAADRGDLLAAEGYFKRALEIQEKQALGSQDVAFSLHNLGVVAEDRGDLLAAESYYKRALDIEEKQAPGSMSVAVSLGNMGIVASGRGDHLAAESYYKRALDIEEKQAPGSLYVASILYNLGIVRVNQPHSDQAIPLFTQAINIIEAQRGKIAGAEARRLLAEAYTDAYTDLLDAYITLHQDASAFNTLERQRGRSLAESLFEHQHIDFTKDVPPNLLVQQKKLDNDRNIALKERQQLDPNDPKDQPGYTKNDAALQAISVKQRQLEDEIRRASPRYANLQYPKPLDLNTVQHTLDPGTLLLEYAIDEQTTYLFTVTNNALHCYPISVTRKDLLARIQAFSESLEKENAPRNPTVAVELYNLLIKPAQKQIQAAQRLLFCPEKELWKLPFCALIDNNNAEAPHYLVESKPIHSVVAMNVYAQLLQSRSQPRTATHPLLAFGDPAYRLDRQNQTASSGPDSASIVVARPEAFTSSPTSGASSISTQSTATVPTQRVLLGGRSFDRRAITGVQARVIAALFGRGAVVHLGKEATPSTVIKEAGSARILHFACHGWLDNSDPLASFLALTPERSTDQFGMLAAYDVIQSLRLNADLVTLAACETGAGEQSSTEGVIGLTRAFAYAGAHSVLVTLWEIDANSSSQLLSGTDPLEPEKQASTSAIEHSFYGALRAGKSKDEALRIAQMALIHGKRLEYRDPRNWAAFSLQGDWR